MTPKEFLRAVVDAWNSHDVDRILALFHEDYENDQAPLPVMRGLAAYREHLLRWFMDVFVLRDGRVWRQRGYWDFSLYTGRVSPLVAGG